ncbi:uncharacterized protein LOC125224494 isoform X2 [Salvia hispanica]|nr:uncharacterized protein LOC125224494 isoform X2 [Salvia hispanica]
MDPQVVMNCVRVIFSVEGGVLCVKEVHERRVDAFFRLRYFGFLRNFFWDRRGEAKSMCLSHTQMPTNLKSGEEDGSECSTRKAEEDGNECSTSEAEEEANIRSSAPDSPAGTNNINVNSHLERPIRGRIGNTPPPPPRPPDDNMVPARRSRPIDYEPSSNNVVEKDSFVHIMLLVFALIVFIWLRLF